MFKDDLIEALKSGIILLVKYGLIIVAILYAAALANDTRIKAVNGEQAAAAIVQFQKHGWLPAFNQDGTVPDKPKVDETK